MFMAIEIILSISNRRYSSKLAKLNLLPNLPVCPARIVGWARWPPSSPAPSSDAPSSSWFSSLVPLSLSQQLPVIQIWLQEAAAAVFSRGRPV